jgi:polyferredoxin
MTPEELDTQLAAPLAAVTDDGFSALVAARIAARQEFRIGVAIAALLAVAGMALIFIPLDRVNAMVESLVVDLGNSAPVAIALATLLLCSLYLRAAEAD